MSAAARVKEAYDGLRPQYEVLAVDLESNTPGDQPPSPYAWQVLRVSVDSDSWWMAARGRLAKTLDAGLLAAQVRRSTKGTIHAKDQLLIITNQEIAPPPDWTYVIWNVAQKDNAAVISGRQMDPYFWSTETDQRFAIIEQRLSAAMFSALGELTGLQRCDNPACYMLDGVTSVLELDDMTGYGPEHHLEGAGHNASSDDG